MKNTRCPYTFKDAAAQSCFYCAVHQAILDTCELDYSEEFLHLAGDDDGDMGAPATMPEDIPDTSRLVPDCAPVDDFGVTALIAVGIWNLIKD